MPSCASLRVAAALLLSVLAAGAARAQTVAVLEPPTPTSFGFFGSAVAGIGDVTGDGRGDVLVGAPSNNGGAADSGEAFLFDGAAGTLVRTLVSPTPEANGDFGRAVAEVPDADGDGVPDVLVSAYLEDAEGITNSGRAYLFSGATGALLHTLASADPVDNGRFGLSVAGLPDVNGDGRGDLLVGAHRETAADLGRAGRAYLFSGATGALLRAFEAPTPQASAFFGVSVAAVPDADGDGRPELLIGADFENLGETTSAGRAYLFSGATGELLRTVVSPAPETGGRFANAVAGVPDADGDGRGDLLVGAFAEDAAGAEGAGRAHLFSGATGALLRTVVSPNATQSGLFGTSVAGAPDLDGDGRGDLLVGANSEDTGGLVDSGAAYVLSGATGAVLLTLATTNPQQTGFFGADIAAVPDVDGDGRADVLVGANTEAVGGVQRAGRAYLTRAAPTGSTTFVVSTTADNLTLDGLVSLREAVTAANTNAPAGDAPAGSPTGDRITFAPALAGQGLSLSSGELEITDDLAIENTTGGVLTLGGVPGGGRIARVNTPEAVRLVGLRLVNGAAEDGGCLRVDAGANLELDGVVFAGCRASRSGGGLYASASRVVVTGGQVLDAAAEGTAPADGGGAFYTAGTLILRGGAQLAGTSAGDGGCVRVASGGTLVTSAAGGRVQIRSCTAARDGGGVWTAGSLAQIDGADIESNTAGRDGGGLFATGGGFLSVRGGSSVRSNTAAGRGGGLRLAGGGLVADSLGLGSNTAEVDGGGLYASDGATVQFNNTRTDANTAARSGGGAWVGGGSQLSALGGRFADNQADGVGPGIGGGHVFADASRLTFDSVLLDLGRAAGRGGALSLSGGSVATVTGGAVQRGSARIGGGVWLAENDSLIVAGTTLATNTAATDGGALYSDGAVVLTGATVQNNAATGLGGAVYNALTGTLDASGTAWRANSALDGGGLYNDGALELLGGVLEAHSARAGGAIWNGGTLTVAEATLRGNQATDRGGAVFSSGGTATFDRSLFAGNGLPTTAAGGAVHLEAGQVRVVNSTVTGGAAVRGAGLAVEAGVLELESVTVAGNGGAGTVVGGLDRAAGQLRLANTLVANNLGTASPDCAGLITSDGHNLIETPAGCQLTGQTATNVLNRDPALLALADNGGPTQTLALGSGSPAVNVGRTTLNVDQRGLPRPLGPAPDIGAVESPFLVDGEAGPAMTAPFELGRPWPNPALGAATVRFGVRESQAVEVAVYDLLGRHVRTLFAGTAPGGSWLTARVPAGSLAPGAYLVRLSGAGIDAVQRLTVLR